MTGDDQRSAPEDDDVLRGVLAGAVGGVGGLPATPPWAVRSVVKDGGVLHELVSALHPMAMSPYGAPERGFPRRTEVSVSMVDRHSGRRWSRAAPMIHVEGGSFTLPEARRLIQAIEDLLTRLS